MKSFFLFSVWMLVLTCCILPISVSSQSMDGGGYHSVKVCDDGTVNTWGNNMFLQCGQVGSSFVLPGTVAGLTGVTAVTAGADFTLALKNDGTVWAWGDNYFGQLGNGTTVSSAAPVQVASLSGVVAISSQGYHSLALLFDGTVRGWGRNEYGQVGIGNPVITTPMQIPSLNGVTQIECGYDYSLVLRYDGTVWAWGNNAIGQLGDSTTVSTDVPQMVQGLADITVIGTGGEHALAVKSDGSVLAWGTNFSGQLGNGTTDTSFVPVPVHSLTDVVAVAAGTVHSLALKADGTVWVWGNDTEGQLGLGPASDNTYVPVRLDSLTGIVAIAAGWVHSIAVDSNGLLKVWGGNFDWQLGTGNNINSQVPVEPTGVCGTATALQEVGQQTSVSIFPNPFPGSTTVQLPMWVAQAKLVIVNGSGQVVRTVDGFSSPTIVLDRKNLPQGIYLLRVTQQDTVIATKKLVIME